MNRRLRNPTKPSRSSRLQARLVLLALALPSTTFASDVADFRSSTLPTGWTLGGAAVLTAGKTAKGTAGCA